MSLAGRDLGRWYEDMCCQAAAQYGVPAVFRPHPVSVERGGAYEVQGFKTCTKPLDESLDGAAVVITWNSNTGVDALMRGVPVVAYDEGSMVYSVTANRIGVDFPVDYLDRLQDIAWCQWSESEMRDGSALEHALRSVC